MSRNDNNQTPEPGKDKRPENSPEHSSEHTESVTVQEREIGGRTDGPEPTRYGDWEKNGRCIDF